MNVSPSVLIDDRALESSCIHPHDDLSDEKRDDYIGFAFDYFCCVRKTGTMINRLPASIKRDQLVDLWRAVDSIRQERTVKQCVDLSEFALKMRPYPLEGRFSFDLNENEKFANSGCEVFCYYSLYGVLMHDLDVDALITKPFVQSLSACFEPAFPKKNVR